MRQRILAGIILSLAAATSDATVLSYSYSGNVTGILNFDGAMPVPLQIGDPFTIAFTWDNGVADLDPDPTHWYGVDALQSVSVTIPGYSVSFSTFAFNETHYYNDHVNGSSLNDGFYMSATKDYYEAPLGAWYVTASLLNEVTEGSPGPWRAGNADPSLGFPNPADFAPPIYQDWNAIFFPYSADGSRRWNFTGLITSGYFAPVPIPAVGWLLGPALGVLGWVRRRS